MSIETSYIPIDLQPDVAVGILLPIVRPDGTLFAQSYTTEQQAISNLKNLILTRRGERLMQPLFGTTIQDSLFEQNTDDLINNIRNSIEEAVEFWLPYIIINTLVITPVVSVANQTEEHGVTISLNVSVSEQGANIPLTFLVTGTTIEQL